MGLLKLAGTETTKVFTEDQEDWIELRASVSKGTINTLLSSLPDSMMQRAADGSTSYSFKEATSTTQALFGSLVVGWSLPVEASVENYLALDNKAGDWVDSSLYNHFNSLQMSKDEQGKL